MAFGWLAILRTQPQPPRENRAKCGRSPQSVQVLKCFKGLTQHRPRVNHLVREYIDLIPACEIEICPRRQEPETGLGERCAALTGQHRVE